MTPARHRALQRLRHGWRRLRRSLHWRLVALFLLLACGTTLVFVLGTRQAFTAGWRELVRPLIADYVDHLAAEIGDPPDLARAQALTQRLPLAVAISGPRLNWRSHPPHGADWAQADSGADSAANTAPHQAIDGATPGDAGPAASLQSRGRGEPTADAGWPKRRRAELRAMLTRHTRDGHQLRFGLQSGRWIDAPSLHLPLLLGLLGLTALAFAYVRRLLKPLDDIRAGVQRFGDGRFQPPIPVRRRDELGDLAGQVNRMAGSLQRMLEGQRGLLLAISHELRSPLTRARLNAELLPDGGERDALLRDLSQMRDLISDLLESERLAGGHTALQREPSDLNALLHEQLLAAQERHGSRWPSVSLLLQADLPTLQLDRSRVALLLRNLLDNAVRHGQGSALELRSQRLPDGRVACSVRDHGPGVAADQLHRLGQPFHRPDAARSREAGGVGLGLYLCRLVAQSHGGELLIERAEPGLRVTLLLPTGS